MSFAFPNEEPSTFDKSRYYFLGPIVTFENGSWQEVIDGQQRITTIMLLLRAFYESFDSKKTKDKNILGVRDAIEKCLWSSDDYNNIDKSQLKLETLVATDDDREDFRCIMDTALHLRILRATTLSTTISSCRRFRNSSTNTCRMFLIFLLES